LVNNLQSNTTSSEIIEFTKEEEKITHLQKELLFGKFGSLKHHCAFKTYFLILALAVSTSFGQ
jgi:hypothetical protein